MHIKLKICNSNGAINQRNVTYYLNQFQWKKTKVIVWDTDSELTKKKPSYALL